MIPAGAVHVWRANLDVPIDSVPALRECLSAEEQARAGRFFFERDARRWTVARAALRLLLASYLRLAPRLLRFRSNPWGKPALDPVSGLRFNLSHSGGVALYAFTQDAALGVDVEEIRDGRADGAIVERFFSPREVRDWASLTASARRDAFFRCWTRKEAYIKAVGRGLAIPLDTFDVSLSPGDPPALLEARHPSDRKRRWHLSDVDLGPGYAAALAVEGPAPAVLARDWCATSFAGVTK